MSVGIPAVPPGLDPALTQFLQGLRNAVAGLAGVTSDPNAAAVTQATLNALQLTSTSAAGLPVLGPAVGVPQYNSGEYPDPMTGLTVSPAVGGAFISWTMPTYTQAGTHDHTEVWAATGASPTFASATILGTSIGSAFIDSGQYGQNRSYWIFSVGKNGNRQINPTGGTNGVQVSTNKVGDSTLDRLTANKIQIVDADVISMNVSKLLAGSLAVSQYISSTTYVPGSSGWTINANGTAEFAAASIRGTLSAGSVGAWTITVGQYIQSSNYVAGTSGWKIDGSGAAQFPSAYILGTLTASQISVSSLSSLSANAGTISAGTINGVTINGAAFNVSTTGYLAGGQSAYATGSGFWIGYAAGLYKFSIGTSGAMLTWDGSNLAINGSAVTGGTVQTAASGQRVALNESSSATARFYNSSNVLTGELSGTATAQGPRLLVAGDTQWTLGGGYGFEVYGNSGMAKLEALGAVPVGIASNGVVVASFASGGSTFYYPATINHATGLLLQNGSGTTIGDVYYNAGALKLEGVGATPVSLVSNGNIGLTVATTGAVTTAALTSGAHTCTTLSASGAATLSSTLAVTGNTSITGRFGCNGATPQPAYNLAAGGNYPASSTAQAIALVNEIGSVLQSMGICS
jgi:hypothetical protein